MSENKHETNYEEINAIIELAQEHDLDALTLVDGDFELSITRREAPIASAPYQPVAALPLNQTTTEPAQSLPTPAATAKPNGQVVTAPIIGVFYRASAPEAPVFVNVGDHVQVGQILCILEAMKLMNEITSDYAGVVTAIHVENSDLVTIGQPLFTVSP
jgi:acetyl-CoA carboxylase biotin carboxyl carrier protein